MPDHCGDLTVLVKITLFGEKEEKVHFLVSAKSMGDMVKRAIFLPNLHGIWYAI